MKNIWLLTLALLSACNTSQKTVSEAPVITDVPADPVVYAETITEEELKEHLYTYASDEFEGRETGKPGQKKAVEYLKNNYESMQVEAAKDNGDYFQKVPLEVAKLPTGSITLGDQQYEIGDGFVSFKAVNGEYAELVYVGYGIDDEAYSDYKDVDVSGKIVLVKAGEPKNEDGTYRISGTNKKSDWGNDSEALTKKRLAAKQHGAKVIMYYDPGNYTRYSGYYNFMNSSDDGQMTLKDNATNPSLILLANKTAETIIPEIKSTDTTQTLELAVKMDLESSNEDVDSENVIAYIPGFEKPDEFVIISSHLDHIGISANGDINNGADDDGSGTVAMLEIAEAFKKAVETGSGPKRSIVFLHVTGEEKGLLGSQHYTDVEPIFPS